MAAGMSGLALLTATVLGAAVFAVLAPLWLSRDANPPSTCHIRALTRLRDGSARRICLEFTEYSAWADYARHWAWAPLCWTGVALQRLGWFLIQDGELLRSGHWLHFTWITQEVNIGSSCPTKPNATPPAAADLSRRRTACAATGGPGMDLIWKAIVWLDRWVNDKLLHASGFAANAGRSTTATSTPH